MNLDENKIEKIENLKGLENIKNLSLKMNNIQIIENLETCKSLQNLNLSENPVKEIKSLGSLENLSELRIHNNKLPPKLLDAFEISHTTQVIPDIEKVKSYCRNEYVEINEEIIFASNSHEYGPNGIGLYLGYKEIASIKTIKNLSNIKNLKALYLFRNNIENIEGLDELDGLESVHLEYNNILKLQGLSSLKKLKFLNLSNNKIKEIENLHELSNLGTLNLNGNSIKEVTNIESLKSLKSLNLNENCISKIRDLKSLINLQELYLKNNHIKKIENLGSLKNLEILDLSYNEVDDITAIGNLPNLRELNISHNNIRNISILSKSLKLHDLDLSNNNIESLGILKYLLNLRSLHLSGNTTIEPIIKSIREKSSEKNFAKNTIGFCILEELLEIMGNKSKNIIKLEKCNDYHHFLSKFKYPNIKRVINIVTDKNIDFQVGKNNFVTSIISPKYIAKKLDELLNKIEQGDSYKYEYLKEELQLYNIKVLKKMTKYIENEEINQISYVRKNQELVKRSYNYRTRKDFIINTIIRGIYRFQRNFQTIKESEDNYSKNLSGIFSEKSLVKIDNILFKYNILSYIFKSQIFTY